MHCSLQGKFLIITNYVESIFYCNQLHLSCLKIKLTCQPNRRYYIDCHEGDKFVIRTKYEHQRFVSKNFKMIYYLLCLDFSFCFHEKPVGPKFGSTIEPIYSRSNIKIWFQSPSRKSRARCLVQCIESTGNGKVIHQT